MSDAPTYRDRLPAPEAEGEEVLAEFRPDRMAYIRNHLQWAALGGVVAVVVLLLAGRGDIIWAAVAGVLLAMLLRGALLYRDVMRMRWLLTATELRGPGERIARADILRVKPVFGGLAVATGSGRKVLIQYLADPAAAAALIRGTP